MTALAWAVFKGQFEVVQFLLAAGANKDSKDKVNDAFVSEVVAGENNWGGK